MKKILTALVTGAVAVGLSVAGVLPASATEPVAETYVTAVWVVPGTELWPAEGQKLNTSVTQADKVLNVALIDSVAAQVGCGFTLQGDLYVDNAATTSLLAGGVLYGAGNPFESWPGEQYQSDYSKVVYTGDCPVVIPPVEPPVVVVPPVEPPVVVVPPVEPPVVEPPVAEPPVVDVPPVVEPPMVTVPVEDIRPVADIVASKSAPNELAHTGAEDFQRNLWIGLLILLIGAMLIAAKRFDRRKV